MSEQTIKQSKNHTKCDIALLETAQYKLIIGLTIHDSRPHLFLLCKKKEYKNWNIFQILRNHEMFSNLVHIINQSFQRYRTSIFSIHLGQYQSKESPHFHAHLLLPIEEYIKIINQHHSKDNAQLNTTEYWTKLENWSNRLKYEGIAYKKSDISNINKIISQYSKSPKSPQSSKSPQSPKSLKDDSYEIIFHSSQPRIGFRWVSSSKSVPKIRSLIRYMLSYIQEKKLNDCARGGCHLCIQNGYYVDEEFGDIMGYIQVDPINYYKMNPMREIWYEKYKKAEFYVVT